MVEPTYEMMFADTVEEARRREIAVADDTPPAKRHCIVNGLKLHYLDWGTPGKPPLVLVHGGAVNAHSWDFFSLAMRAHFHIYAVDLPGHGDSEWAPDGDYRRERVAADLLGLIDALEIAPFILIGHSFGGSVSLLAARQIPGRVRALVVVDSTLAQPQEPNAIQAFVRGPDLFPSLEAFAEHAARFNPRRSQASLMRSLRWNTMRRPDGMWTWKYDRALRDVNRRSPALDYGKTWAAMRALPCPILVVRAGEKSHISDAAVAELGRLAPRVRLTVVPHARHSVMGDNPLAFERAVATFLEAEGMLRSAVQ